ncbi:MAG: TatD family hydrolase [Bacteriovoracaceae bacterium]|jgi:TatD DNase family protein|nr:TatD family hydrolase [Bacteriovoracaceae bacterium]
MTHKFIETHCHLDYLKEKPLEEILEDSKKAGIEYTITISVEPGNMDPVLEIAKSHENIYCTQGVHPHNAKDFTDTVLEKIKLNSSHPKVLAIGEIGLDYHYDNSPREAQLAALEKQLELACELELPVVIHTREAEEDTMSILKNFSGKLKKGGVIHSFTSSTRFAEFALSENFHIGFNGIITFKKAQNVRDVLEITPIENILLETDSPFLAPTPHRGRENYPCYIPFIAAKLLEVKNLDEQAFDIIYQNSKRLFAIA